MKKYLLFAGHEFYPDGGMEDFEGDYDSLDEIKEIVKNTFPEKEYNWYQIVEYSTLKIIKSGKFR